MSTTRNILLALALGDAALAAGFFYAYSFSVMDGLSNADPSAAIRAMQSINASIRTPLFAFVFFGCLLLPLAAGAAALATTPASVGWLAFAAAAAYGLGVIAVTFAANLPLNDQLAAAAPDGGDPAAIWRAYAGPWRTWNHVRTLFSLLSFALLAAAVALAFRPSEA